MEYLLIILGIVIIVLLVVILLRFNNLKNNKGIDEEQLSKYIEKFKREILEESRGTRQEIGNNIQNVLGVNNESLTKSLAYISKVQDRRLEGLQKNVNDVMSILEKRIASFTIESSQRLEYMRSTMENKLENMQENNNKKLDEMRSTVDEKLQKTLEDRIGQSFMLVSDRLEQVYKGLGEMQSLASGVGDLKKVLSNVKTRGILGEIQLGAILEQMLAPEQYEANVTTKKGTSNMVEYAIKLPGDENGTVYLPIDAKFPADTYSRLIDAYENGIANEIQDAGKALESRIKQSAKDIRDKYIDPPNTTDFGIMFLPFEGLYAEVVRRGMVEVLQRDYKINIAGPTTMAALVNSLQMGFRTLAIQKRSGEVWNVLGAVKTEFDKFGEVLQATQRKLDQANSDLDKLVGVRTRQIQRKLSLVTKLPEEESDSLLSTVEIEE